MAKKPYYERLHGDHEGWHIVKYKGVQGGGASCQTCTDRCGEWCDYGLMLPWSKKATKAWLQNMATSVTIALPTTGPVFEKKVEWH